jgi:transposase
MKPISLAVRSSVKSKLLEGKSVTQVQEEMGLSRDFIHKIREEVKENIPEPKSGRPTKVTKRTQAALASKMHAGDFSCLRDAQSYSGGQK